MNKLEDVVKTLRSSVLRVRTGLLLIPSNKMSLIVDEAIRIDIEHFDANEYWLEKLPKNTKFAKISSKKIIKMADDISQIQSLDQCVLIYNFDLLISFLKYEDRKTLWAHLINNMPHRPRALLLAIPFSKESKELLPSKKHLDLLEKELRLATLT